MYVSIKELWEAVNPPLRNRNTYISRFIPSKHTYLNLGLILVGPMGYREPGSSIYLLQVFENDGIIFLSEHRSYSAIDEVV